MEADQRMVRLFLSHRFEAAQERAQSQHCGTDAFALFLWNHYYTYSPSSYPCTRKTSENRRGPFLTYAAHALPREPYPFAGRESITARSSRLPFQKTGRPATKSPVISAVSSMPISLAPNFLDVTNYFLTPRLVRDILSINIGLYYL